MTASQTTSASYEVGYRKPPRHTQFQKGQSGNPGGRPRRSPARDLEELALDEAYRTTIVVEDGIAMPMPVIQAVLRRQLQSAAGGNVRAQRDILAMIRDIEQIRSIASLCDNDGADDVVDDTDDADTNDGKGNGVEDSADDNDVDDIGDADHHHAGGADDDEPARQQADGSTRTARGGRRSGNRLRRSQSAPRSPDGAAAVRRSTPAKFGESVQEARGVRRAGRSPRPRLQAGTPARRPPLLNETKN